MLGKEGRAVIHCLARRADKIRHNSPMQRCKVEHAVSAQNWHLLSECIYSTVSLTTSSQSIRRLRNKLHACTITNTSTLSNGTRSHAA